MSNRKTSTPPPVPARGPGKGMMPAQKSKNFGKTMWKLVRYSFKEMPAMLIALVFAIASVILTLFVPELIGTATDGLFEGALQKECYRGIERSLPEMGLEGVDTMQKLSEWVSLRTGKEKTAIVFEDFYDILPEEAQAGFDVMREEIPKAYLGAFNRTSFYYPPTIDTGAISRVLILACILILVSGFISYIQGFILSGTAQRISYRLRKDIDRKIFRLPLRFYDDTPNGEVLSYLTNDIDSISTTLNQSLSQLVTSVTTIIGVLVMMIRLSLILTGISIAIIPLSLILMVLVVKFSQKHFIGQQKYLAKVNSHVEETYAGHEVVMLNNGQTDTKAQFDVLNGKLAETSEKSQFLSGLMMPIMTFLGNIGYVAVCLFGGMIAIGGMGSGTLTAGDIQSFLMYLRRFNQPIGQMANIVNTLQSTAAAGERVFAFLEAEEEAETGAEAPQETKGEVEFRNVRFGYKADKIVINDFSSHILPGQRVAIVGPTGAGKTTIVKLLMRYYALNGGSILLDGTDITRFSRHALREELSMVLQDTWLFNGTVLENIRYGKRDATDEEVMEAAKIACADTFIRQLPDSYHFVINEEADNISQGQKQLLTIARAVLNDPKVLILDEATSSVDTRTELLIQKAIDRLLKGRTSFIIAHRLSTIKDADLILVLKEGDIVEQGTHQELLQKKGFYESLYNAQFAE